MEEITIYKAVDGTRFDSKGDCEYYESVIDNVNNIMTTTLMLATNLY